MPFNFLNKDKCTRDYYYHVTDIWHRLGIARITSNTFKY